MTPGPREVRILEKAFGTNDKSQASKGTKSLFVLLWIAWLLILIAIGSSSAHDNLQAALSDPVYFKARESLKRTPPLSDRLKIYGLDDGTVGFLGSPEVTTKDFTLLLTNIAKKKPKAILLDKLFGGAPTDPDHQRLIEDMIKLNVPIYSGASMHPAPLGYRKPNELQEDPYSLEKWTEGDVRTEMPFLKESIHHVNGYIYSFDEAYAGLFKGVGHLAFDRIGSVYPIVSFGERILPHISLYAADKAVIKKESLLLDGNRVPLTDKGGVIVNHRPVHMFYERMKSLKSVINRARNDVPEDWIKEGDVVVILFNFYTGSTDFLEGAPFGNLPGGLMVSTMVDAVMEHRWITPLEHVHILIIVLSVLGSLLARTTGPVMYWPAVISAGFLYFCIAIYLFAYKDVMMPWVLPLCGLAGAGTIQYVQQRLSSEIKAVATQNQLLVERALRLEEEKTNLQLAERLNLGRAVQQILMPPLGSQEHGPFHFAMGYTPNQEMSGDWIYIWGKDQTEKRIILGDVVGKGPSAAIPVAILIGILGECERAEMNMDSTFQHLNRRVLELFGRQVTCSCSAVVMNEGSLEVELYNAGSPGWFHRSEGKATHISMRSTTLGMDETAYIAREKIQLTPGAFILTFTDGYMEGARAFRRLITRMGATDTAPELNELQDMLDEIGKGFRLEDDKSLLILTTKQKARLKRNVA
jgi:hypothetical protein